MGSCSWVVAACYIQRPRYIYDSAPPSKLFISVISCEPLIIKERAPTKKKKKKKYKEGRVEWSFNITYPQVLTESGWYASMPPRGTRGARGGRSSRGGRGGSAAASASASASASSAPRDEAPSQSDAHGDGATPEIVSVGSTPSVQEVPRPRQSATPSATASRGGGGGGGGTTRFKPKNVRRDAAERQRLEQERSRDLASKIKQEEREQRAEERRARRGRGRGGAMSQRGFIRRTVTATGPFSGVPSGMLPDWIGILIRYRGGRACVAV